MVRRSTEEALKRNRQYNEERQYLDGLVKRDLDRDYMLERMYNEHLTRIQSQIDQLWLNYANAKGITVAEMKKQASKMDVQAFAEAAKLAVKTKDFSEGTNTWLKTFNAKMRISRLELLKANVELELHSLSSEQNKLFDRERFDEATRELKRQMGFLNVSDSKVNIQKVLDADFYGKGFSERVWYNNMTIKKVVFDKLNRIYTDMDGFKKQRAELVKQFGVSRYEAQRLLKTEIARINSNIRTEVYNENGFTHFINVAESDACSICEDMAGYPIPIEKREIGETCAPFHPNCRCSDFAQIEMKRKDGTSNLDEYRKEDEN